MIPLRVALVGAGIFARDAHLPALMALRDQFEIVAIYSRTRERAAALADQLESPPDICTDLAALLTRDDVEAVDILLPIEQLATAVDMSLAAGKHVISEKPIAPTVAEGRRLLSIYEHHPDQVWMVAENWRYEEVFIRAAEKIPDIGRPLACHWALHIAVTPENKYYHTEWRRSGTFPGGFLLDGGVHQIAVLRQILGEINRVSAFTAQMRPDLPPADTLTAALEFETGLMGSYLVSYAASAGLPNLLWILGDQGVLRVDRGLLEIVVNGQTRDVPLDGNKNVNDELAAFAAAVRERTPHRNTPQEALQDVAVIEAMLRSAASGKAVDVERIVW
jgi:predicted dehydrogenase